MLNKRKFIFGAIPFIGLTSGIVFAEEKHSAAHGTSHGAPKPAAKPVPKSVTSAEPMNANVCNAYNSARQAAITPDQAINELKEGNKRFLAGKSTKCDLLKNVADTAAKQTPIAVVVGCIDSRVPPELVFDQQIGDIFAARIAGNFINYDILGSVEYATKVAGAKAIIVLGHSSCGAIKGAIDNVKLGHITGLLDNVMPAVNAAHTSGEKSSHNHELVDEVTEINVRQNVAKLLHYSPIIRELMAEGKLKIIGAVHDVHTGEVRFL